MKKIESVLDVKNLIKQKNIKVFGIGGTPITRTEAHHLLDIDVICSVDAKKEIAAIRKKVNIKCFPLKNKNGMYTKKPSKILSNKRVQEYIKNVGKKYDKVAIYVMKPDRLIEEICNKNNWILIGNTAEIIKKYNDKQVFQQMLQQINLANNAITIKLSELSNKIDYIFEKLGTKIVIQLPEVSGGGHGTFFFEKNEKEKILSTIQNRINIINEEIPESTNIIVNSFFDGPTLSVLGCITQNNGILVARPQHQLIDIPEVITAKNDANGVFCGHEWTLPISVDIYREINEITKRIGEYLQKKGVKGIFGIDLVWDKEKKAVMPIEINTRLTGVFPSFVDVQVLNKELPILSFHILDFLNISYKVDKCVVESEKNRTQGAHLIVFNNFPYKIRITKSNLQGGVYSLQKNKLHFERDGFEMSDIFHEGEFVITDGVPELGSIYAKNRKLLKIISKDSLGKSSYELNDFGKEIVTNIYNSITCEKYE
jgi:hypothetical protein